MPNCLCITIVPEYNVGFMQKLEGSEPSAGGINHIPPVSSHISGHYAQITRMAAMGNAQRYVSPIYILGALARMVSILKFRLFRPTHPICHELQLISRTLKPYSVINICLEYSIRGQAMCGSDGTEPALLIDIFVAPDKRRAHQYMSAPQRARTLLPQWGQPLVQAPTAISWYLSNWQSYTDGRSTTIRIASRRGASKTWQYRDLYSMTNYGEPLEEEIDVDGEDACKSFITTVTTRTMEKRKSKKRRTRRTYNKKHNRN